MLINEKEQENLNSQNTATQEDLSAVAEHENKTETVEATEDSPGVDEEEYLNDQFLKSLSDESGKEDKTVKEEKVEVKQESNQEEDLSEENIYKNDPDFEKAVSRHLKPVMSEFEKIKKENEELKAKILNINPVIEERRKKELDAGVNKAKEAFKSRNLDPDKSFKTTMEFLNKNPKLLDGFSNLPLPIHEQILMAHEYMNTKKLEFLTPDRIQKLKEQGVKEHLQFKKSNISRDAGTKVSEKRQITEADMRNWTSEQYKEALEKGIIKPIRD